MEVLGVAIILQLAQAQYAETPSLFFAEVNAEILLNPSLVLGISMIIALFSAFAAIKMYKWYGRQGELKLLVSSRRLQSHETKFLIS